jgi:hypothetical protein
MEIAVQTQAYFPLSFIASTFGSYWRKFVGIHKDTTAVSQTYRYKKFTVEK